MFTYKNTLSIPINFFTSNGDVMGIPVQVFSSMFSYWGRFKKTFSNILPDLRIGLPCMRVWKCLHWVYDYYIIIINCLVGIYFAWPLRKQADLYKATTKGTLALSPFWWTRAGNEDKVPCPRALLPLPADLNRGPHDWVSVVLSTESQQLLRFYWLLYSIYWLQAVIGADIESGENMWIML